MSSKRSEYTQAGQALVQQQAGKDAGRQALETHNAFLQARVQKLAQWVTGGLRPEALIRFALLDLQNSDKLRACEPASIYLALLACAQTGLEPGALKGEAFLVPFARKAQFMAGWKGLVKMARRSREVRGLTAEIVRERDVFELELGTDQRIIHKPSFGDRGMDLGAYAVAKMAHGEREIEWMDRDDLGRIQAIAEQRGKSPAWRDWPDQMARKSVLRRLCKRLPLGQDYFVATTIEVAQEERGDAAVVDVLDVLTDGEASRAEAAQAQAREMAPRTEEEEILAAEAKEANRG